MSGAFRFFLSILVVLAHLTEGISQLSHYGVFAVFGFYIISGYLITLILNKTYSFNFFQFSANRFLRLFPIYYLASALTIFVFYLIPDRSDFHSIWPESFTSIDKLSNLLIFPFAFYQETFRIVPPSWSVAVELVCYFMLWAFVARSRPIALVTFLVTILYHTISYLHGDTWDARYAPFYAALLPFSIGSLIHFYRDSIDRLASEKWKQLLSILSIAWLTNSILCGNNGGLGAQGFDKYYYLNLVFLSAICALITNSAADIKIKRAGKILGDLAYPIFLTHWIVAFAISHLINERRGIELFLISLPAIIALSYATAKLAEIFIEPIRDLVRPKANSAPSQEAKESPA